MTTRRTATRRTRFSHCRLNIHKSNIYDDTAYKNKDYFPEYVFSLIHSNLMPRISCKFYQVRFRQVVKIQHYH